MLIVITLVIDITVIYIKILNTSNLATIAEIHANPIDIESKIRTITGYSYYGRS